MYGIYEETGNNNSYIRNQFIPYPYPVGNGGAQQAPLQSATADGMAFYTLYRLWKYLFRLCEFSNFGTPNETCFSVSRDMQGLHVRA